MKSLFIHLITSIALVAALPAQNVGGITNATDFKKLEQGLIELRELMKKDAVSHTEAVPLEMEIRHQVDNIYLDINTRLSTEERLNSRQNQEWRTFIEQLGNTLEPHEDVILESAYQPLVEKNRDKRQLNRFTFDADQLISFLKLDSDLDNKIRDKLEDYPTLRWRAYRHLHELRLLTEADVQQMVALGETITDPQEKIRWAEEISFYGSDAGLELLEEIISKPFDPTGPVDNESYLSYVPVMRSIRYLGTRAEKLSPFIRERQNEVFNSYKKRFGPDIASAGIRLFFSMENSIETGRIPYLSARNGSGILYPPGWDKKDEKAKRKPKPTLDLAPGKQDEAPDSSPKKRFSILKNRSFLLWILGLVIFLGSIAWTVKRKKSS